MNIVAVDRDEQSLWHLTEILRGLYPGASVTAFTDPMYAVKLGLNQPIDLVFTEIRMNPLDGLTLIQTLRKRFPRIKAFVVTGGEERRAQAACLKVDGFLIKPVDAEGVRAAVERAAFANCVEETEK